MNNEPQALTMDAQLEAMAVSHNVTTLLLDAPNGGYVVYVSPRERDVTRGVMSALIDIRLKRGEFGADGDTVVIRPSLVSSPGNEYYYELRGVDGKVDCFGYAPSEAIARERMAEFERKQHGAG